VGGLEDRAVVTFENVPEFQMTNSNNFQIELFYDGRVRITYLQMDTKNGVVGISEGVGLAADFAESDLSNFDFCTAGMLLILR